MVFQEFLKYVPHFSQLPLPAAEAHLKMAPEERIQLLKNLNIEAKKPRIAAVMMLLYPKNDQTHIVLIVRNSYNGVHSSQIAFPGGKYELDDLDFAYTALRETHEEIGVLPEKIKVIRPFTPMYIPPSNFQVHPFLGISEQELYFFPDPKEVADIIEWPLEQFLDDANLVETKMTTSYASNITVPAFQIENQFVWGATAMILSELKEVLKTVLNTK
ncbi:NUDIX hydrolase [Flavobacterium agrisoli]|uniref:CoA pyrophosphatase n=1 Tax=Flavobacterium agrisoli TaxID=2793066 RepID=A0A934PJ93_9FLAO|nr:CoA pyrophosphatase [Flavobacterium agrisoli]MBK0369146.1 CoA pyrophosphatase [Flavobacterium agrisoli]